MTPYYGIQVRDDFTYEVYVTEDGIVRHPIPKAVFPTPRAADAYASMRQANVSPLRVSEDGPAPSPAGPSSEALTGLGS